MRLIPLLFATVPLLICHQAAAAQKSVTFFLDGARVEQEAAAANGYLELALPDSLIPGSLRVKALEGGSVLRVELVAAEQDRRRAREIAVLEERKGELQDRMAVLVRREEIYSAAAKSQSGKAPRKTKSNPNPLGTLQKGTEFALARMESVYRDRRKSQKALDALELELAAARKGVASARIWLAGGKAGISYLVGDARWTPSYDFRWSGDDGGELLLHAKLPQREKGVRYLISNGTVAQEVVAKEVRGDFPTLARYSLTLVGGAPGSHPPLSFAFAAVQAVLPPGDAALFWRGEYLGSGRFAGGGASEFSIDRE